MILQDRKHLAFADQLSILIADANSQNHVHLGAWLGRGVMFFKKLAASMKVCRTRLPVSVFA